MKVFLVILVLLIAVSAGIFLTSPNERGSEINTLTTESAVIERPIEQPVSSASGVSEYVDLEHGFTLRFPPEYKVAQITTDATDTFLLQNSVGTGMQITVSPFDEPAEVLTAKRIQQDLPDLPMRNVRIARMPLTGIEGVLFESSGGGFGESIEFWFVHNGFLYQASTYLANLAFFEDITGTLQF